GPDEQAPESFGCRGMIGRIEHGRKLRSLSRKQRAEPLLLTDVSASAASIDAPSPLAGEGCSEVQYEQPGEGSALAASSDSSPNCGCRSVCAALSRKGLCTKTRAQRQPRVPD